MFSTHVEINRKHFSGIDILQQPAMNSLLLIHSWLPELFYFFPLDTTIIPAQTIARDRIVIKPV